MYLKSHYFQKYQPPKLNNRKNHSFSTKTDVFFDHSTLTAGIFGTTGSSETSCTASDKVDAEAQGRDSTFTICYPLLK